MAFVVYDDSIFKPEFYYDTDTSILEVSLSGSTSRYLSEQHRSRLDGILLRTMAWWQESFAGGRGADRVTVERSYSDKYSVVFSQDSWLFRSSVDYHRKFSYLKEMEPMVWRRRLRDRARVLLVCRLTEPWSHHGMIAHDASLAEPYEIISGDNYLYVVPEQIWIYNVVTGEIFAKISEASLAAEQEQQKLLREKQAVIVP
jgi:hypothetical protein